MALPPPARRSAPISASAAISPVRSRVKDEHEVRRMRMQAAQNASYSAAGQMLAVDYGTMSVPGATRTRRTSTAIAPTQQCVIAEGTRQQEVDAAIAASRGSAVVKAAAIAAEIKFLRALRDSTIAMVFRARNFPRRLRENYGVTT